MKFCCTIPDLRSCFLEKRALQYVLIAAFCVMAHLVLRSATWKTGPVRHTVEEVTSAALAGFVTTLAFVRYSSKKDTVFLFITSGFAGATLLEGTHAAFTTLRLHEHLSLPTPPVIPWSWLTARSFLGLMLFLSYLSWECESRGEAGIGVIWRSCESFIFVAAGLLTLIGVAFVAWVSLPQLNFPSLFFPRPLELLPALLFLEAFIGFWRKGDWRRDWFAHSLMLSLLMATMVHGLFMGFSRTASDAMFEVAHLGKLLSYSVVLCGLLIHIGELYRQVELSALAAAGANGKLRELTETLEKRVEERTALAESRSRELERSNAELERFAYVASHDLQEPLRMVASYTQLLAKRYQGKLDQDADDFIGFAVDGAMRMKRMINDLLAFSRVGREQRALERTECKTAFEHALADLEVSIEEAGAVVTADVLPPVMGDVVQLERLFENLVGNAVKFRSDQPPRIHVGVAPENGHWHFSVTDNGIGIPPEFGERIFQIFQRFHERSKYPGTGIGLALCKRIVERHGGRIWMESSLGRGSTCHFSIPSMEGQNHGDPNQ